MKSHNSNDGKAHTSMQSEAADSTMGQGVNAEPIAIVGIGCRFPQADSPEAFWRLMRDEMDVITEVPADRFDIDAFYDPKPSTPGKIVTRYGGFLEEVDKFDAYFFGISPREAAHMDPQQRILMEVALEAVEDAGLLPEELDGMRGGVFVGMITNDYEDIQFRDLDGINIYASTGGFRSVASGRLSYMLGWQGPSMTIDTACSSSLVAVHLACQSLRSGESTLALAAGVNLILQPDQSLGFSQARMLAPDGRCKFCDARADGFIRSEGAGVVVLKPLANALADGDRIHALIRGGAVNNDGRTSGFLMTPSQEGQQKVIRAAYRDAGVAPGTVQYVEAHGTGTSVGDPTEVGALGAVLSEGRVAGASCLIGSVKTNIGHTEGAAGIAGLIKVALSLEHGAIPASLHFREPSPRIPWDELPFVVPQKLTPWTDGSGTARAGISSFGISGTNAHLVLEEAPRNLLRTAPEETTNTTRVLTLSAHSREALKVMAARYREFFADPHTARTSLSDVCYTSSVKRTHREHRLAMVAETREQLVEHLEAFIGDEPRPGMSHGEARPVLSGDAQGSPAKRKIAFVFPGQGSQWLGMGRRLLEREPAFRASLERCEESIGKFVEWSLVEQLTAAPEHSRLGEIDVIQPTLFAIQVSLAALWRAWGIEPDAVVGHSMGEVAAAHVAGILSLDDAAKIICRRSRLLKRVSGRGAMALVELPLEDAARLLDGYEERLSIAVSNSPASTVLSGEPAALEEILERLRGEDVFCRPIKVDVASHSPQMDPLRADLLDALDGLQPRAAAVPLYSTVTATPADGLMLDAGYWVRNLREPVRFSAATERLLEDGHDIFIEISPNPILLPAIQQVLRHVGHEGGMVLPSMRHDEDELVVMLGALGALHVAGHDVDWSRFFPAGGNRVALPNYPWQRERFWVETKTNGNWRGQRERANGDAATSHPLLGHHLRSAVNAASHSWEAELTTGALPFLKDHRVRELIVLPAAAYVEMALAATVEIFGEGQPALKNFSFKQALFLSDDDARTIQVAVVVERPGEASFQVFSLAAGADDSQPVWTLHASGTIRADDAGERVASDGNDGAGLSLEEIRERCRETISGAEHYAAMTSRALHYGQSFQGVEQVWRQPREAVGLLSPPATLETGAGAYRIHPALLDACFQIFGAALASSGDGALAAQDTYLPVALTEFRLFEPPPRDAKLWSHITLHDEGAADANTVEGDVRLLADDGRVLLEARGLRLQRLERDVENEAASNLDNWLYEIEWRAKPRVRRGTASPAAPDTQERGGWLILTDETGVGERLCAVLEARGETCVLARAGESYRMTGTRRYEVAPSSLEDFQRLLRDVNAREQTALRGVVHLWSLNIALPAATTDESLEAARALHSDATLHVLKSLVEIGDGDAPRFWLVTGGSQAVAEDASADVAFAQAPLWGLGRVIANEHGEFRCRMIDLGGASDATEIDALAEELLGEDDGEPEVALRGGKRFVARLVHSLPRTVSGQSATTKIPTAFGEQPYLLEIVTPGILDSLALRATERHAPGAGEVEIQVYATGLNFRDVMLAMGVLPPVFLEHGRIDLGWECAGVVTAVGEGVDSFRPGDEVIAIAPGCFSAYTLTSAFLVVPKPTHLGFAEAASFPLVFLTAFYALHHMGRMRRGERVLIHAAAGGVGLAAIQIAQHAGAEIYATAGTPEKREYLRSLGVEHIYDSRSLLFAAEVLRDTGGEGVDLVLNSLAGEAIPASLSTLAHHGRFLELGKTDIMQNTPVGLKLFQQNISFFAIDLSQMFIRRPRVCAELFKEVLPFFERGVFTPIPLQVFPVSEIADGFRFLAQAKHTGKVVVSMECDEVLVETSPDDASRALSPEATYLVTGGLGGLGLMFAKWLVERGARHLVLMGRGGASAAAEEAIDELERAGATVRVAQSDVAQREQLAGALEEIKRSMPPLKGIIHAAGLLRDGVLLQQNLERFEAVMAPKIAGSWNLHSLTLDAPLDFFVLFSSVATLLGSPGQGNYSAANAFLDALAHHRRAKGLCALSINWGPWSEIGLAARPDRGGRLADRGLASMTPDEGVGVFDGLLRHERAQVGVMPFDYAQWAQFYASAAGSPFFVELADDGKQVATSDAGSAQSGDGVREALLAVEAGRRRRTLLETYIQEQVAHVLKLSPSRIDTHKPFGTFGLDSLMALEFRNRLEAGLNLKLSATMVWNHPTVAALTSHVASKMGVELEAVAPVVVAESAQSSVAGSFGEEDLEALLDEIKELPSAEVRRIMDEGL